MEKSQNYKTEISNHDMVIRGDLDSLLLLRKLDTWSPGDFF